MTVFARDGEAVYSTHTTRLVGLERFFVLIDEVTYFDDFEIIDLSRMVGIKGTSLN